MVSPIANHVSIILLFFPFHVYHFTFSLYHNLNKNIQKEYTNDGLDPALLRAHIGKWIKSYSMDCIPKGKFRIVPAEEQINYVGCLETVNKIVCKW